jgi:hypothetical protein
MFSAWLRLSVSHHDFIFGEPLDPVGDHPWNSELALCNLFRTFPRMIDADAFAGALTRGSFKTIPACEETTNTQRIEEDSWLGDKDSNQR